jgi:hypothetical protein
MIRVCLAGYFTINGHGLYENRYILIEDFCGFMG